jgi:hypothetical protein
MSPPLMPPKNLSGFSTFLVKYFDHSNNPLFFTQIMNLPLHWLICKGNSMPAQNILTFGGTSYTTQLKMALSSLFIVLLRT